MVTRQLNVIVSQYWEPNMKDIPLLLANWNRCASDNYYLSCGTDCNMINISVFPILSNLFHEPITERNKNEIRETSETFVILHKAAIW